MGRLIRVFVKPVLFRKVGDSGPGCVPLMSDHKGYKKSVGLFPEGGELCYFVEFQPGDGEVVTHFSKHTKVNELLLWKDHKVNLWLKVIYQDMIGWIDVEHVQMIFELDPDDNGDMIEKQVYPYPSDD